VKITPSARRRWRPARSQKRFQKYFWYAKSHARWDDQSDERIGKGGKQRQPGAESTEESSAPGRPNCVRGANQFGYDYTTADVGALWSRLRDHASPGSIRSNIGNRAKPMGINRRVFGFLRQGKKELARTPMTQRTSPITAPIAPVKRLAPTLSPLIRPIICALARRADLSPSSIRVATTSAVTLLVLAANRCQENPNPMQNPAKHANKLDTK
jgi:hypothetical protein